MTRGGPLGWERRLPTVAVVLLIFAMIWLGGRVMRLEQRLIAACSERVPPSQGSGHGTVQPRSTPSRSDPRALAGTPAVRP